MKLFCIASLVTTIAVIALSCGEQSQVSNKWNKDRLMAKGDSITTATFDTMRRALNAAASNGGFHDAVAFCQVAATGITAYYDDSTCTARRVTNKPRNPANQMTEADSIVFDRMQKSLSGNKPPTPELVIAPELAVYYKPIVLQPLCLNCHGEPVKDIQNLVLTTLDSLYPTDKARHYKSGDLRGMWKVSFTK